MRVEIGRPLGPARGEVALGHEEDRLSEIPRPVGEKVGPRARGEEGDVVAAAPAGKIRRGGEKFQHKALRELRSEGDRIAFAEDGNVEEIGFLGVAGAEGRGDETVVKRKFAAPHGGCAFAGVLFRAADLDELREGGVAAMVIDVYAERILGDEGSGIA